ncbi:hypothetical protein RBU49_06690 [Clostridium sp. MB40-C1]|uniref:hypothetical protein n=1 Tax=Clostridium sp. MB40-C1 TaxID=3070996 RepID=UPI0027DEF918|nr:hypothetical protein [Clostridium sp. MB40-C1]WMJ81929.1 hypothetical protein RBU49_06690 [Clostridium sp. MB40-C1]
MYDAKELEKKERDIQYSRYDCIYDRSYYYKVQTENMMNLKSSYVPRENVLE